MLQPSSTAQSLEGATNQKTPDAKDDQNVVNTPNTGTAVNVNVCMNKILLLILLSCAIRLRIINCKK